MFLSSDEPWPEGAAESSLRPNKPSAGLPALLVDGFAYLGFAGYGVGACAAEESLMRCVGFCAGSLAP